MQPIQYNRPVEVPGGEVLSAKVVEDAHSGIFTPNTHVSISISGAPYAEVVAHGRNPEEAIDRLRFALAKIAETGGK